jgi:hypothetical protein
LGHIHERGNPVVLHYNRVAALPGQHCRRCHHLHFSGRNGCHDFRRLELDSESFATEWLEKGTYLTHGAWF